MAAMGKIALLIITLLQSAFAFCQEDRTLVMKGNELYKRQQYDQAAEEYQKAANINSKNSKTLYNLGNALYKGKKNQEAQKVFDDAAKTAKDVNGKEKAVYNKGVTLTRLNKLKESIEAYKGALRLNPADEEARQNLQKALNELKKQQQQQQQNKQNQNQNKQKQNDQPQNNSKLNQKQAEQMLNALRQEEKQLQKGLQKRNNTGGANIKDW